MFKHTSIRSITHLVCQSNRYHLRENSSCRQLGAGLALTARLWDIIDFRHHQRRNPFPKSRHPRPNHLGPSRVPVTEMSRGPLTATSKHYRCVWGWCPLAQGHWLYPGHGVRPNVFERMGLRFYLTWNRKSARCSPNLYTGRPNKNKAFSVFF